MPHMPARREIFGPAAPFYAWGYPPYFLALAALFALFPYLLALVLWQATTLPLYLGAVGAALPRTRTTLLVGAAFPAVFINLSAGHNGFLTAGLLGLGLIVLDRRPILAGILFGCLAYKPQYGLLLPVALAAGFQWRAFVSAGVTVARRPWRPSLPSGGRLARLCRICPLLARSRGRAGQYRLVQAADDGVRRRPHARRHDPARLRRADRCHRRLRGPGRLALVQARRLAPALGGADDGDDALHPLCPRLRHDGARPGAGADRRLSPGKGFWRSDKTILAAVGVMPLVARTVAQATLVLLGLTMTLVLFALIVRHSLVSLRRGAPAIGHSALA